VKPRTLLAPAALLALIACNGPKPNAGTHEAAATPANPAEENAAPPHVVGSEYASTLAADDLFEIASARLALQKSANPDVKALAQALLPTHQQSLAGLKAAAASAQPPIVVKPALNPDQQAKLDALRSLAGPGFDHTFLQQQIDAHEQALKLIAGFAENGDVPTLKQQAQTVEDPVHQHLTRAQNLLNTTPSPHRG
jgi:putative membrane protein